ncbi:hypothetical protein B484DRAFT_459208 [Ochromonadaceae sp. CCMP2298]|nr:hypothetical protein B484DRAFT_459208 [Ochromonadaceae sp. CCMP2298]
MEGCVWRVLLLFMCIFRGVLCIFRGLLYIFRGFLCIFRGLLYIFGGLLYTYTWKVILLYEYTRF